jgi:uncharacterized paraquat-inducible protein A
MALPYVNNIKLLARVYREARNVLRTHVECKVNTCLECVLLRDLKEAVEAVKCNVCGNPLEDFSGFCHRTHLLDTSHD